MSEYVDKIGNGELPAEIEANFLLEHVLPKDWKDFRDAVKRLSKKPMRIFIAEIYRWIKMEYNRKPSERAKIYRKLDCLPNGDKWDPWGYHIVATKDGYCMLPYGRSRSQALGIRRSRIGQWETFKVDWESRILSEKQKMMKAQHKQDAPSISDLNEPKKVSKQRRPSL